MRPGRWPVRNVDPFPPGGGSLGCRATPTVIGLPLPLTPRHTNRTKGDRTARRWDSRRGCTKAAETSRVQPRTPAATTVVTASGMSAKGGYPINVPAPMNPALVDDQALVSAELTGFCGGAVMRPQPDRAEQVNESAFIRDMWSALARASTDNAPRTLAAARDAVFGRYLPMARTLAITPGQGRRPVDPAAAEQAAELGLAQAVLAWRRPDGDGFEVTARAPSQRSCVVSRRRPPGTARDTRRPATGDHRAGPEGVLPTTRWVQRQGKPAHRGVRSTEGRR